jgi:hypothetical protein
VPLIERSLIPLMMPPSLFDNIFFINSVALW